MTWSSTVEKIIEVVLRLPPLFVMDNILNKSFFPEFPLFYYHSTMSWVDYFIWLLVMTNLFVVTFCVFLLSVKHLMDIYSYITSIIILIVSYYWNMVFIRPTQIDDSNPQVPAHADTKHDFFMYDLIQNVVTQIFLSYTFTYIWRLRKGSRFYGHDGKVSVSIGILLSFLFPSILCVINQEFVWSPSIAVIFPWCIMLNDTWNSIRAIFWIFRRAYHLIKLTIETVGIQGFIENHWIRLQVPRVLRAFWIIRVVYQFTIVYTGLLSKLDETAKHEKLYYFTYIDFYSIFLILLTRSCETFIALLGMTSVVSFFAHYIGVFLAFCVGSDSEEDKNMGTVSAILFFILGLQTGLTGLNSEARLTRLCKNFCLLLTAISHFIHSMIHPILMSLSASRSSNIVRHIRVLSMCIFLLTFPTCLLLYLWSHYSISTWLLAVTAFSVEVMLKVCVSLTVYTLFILDAYRDTFWEGLDDYVYYIQSVGNTIEFLFGIFLFCNGAWIMIFESGGAIRAIMMCIHAYFNIWVQAKEGWKVFIKRRTAVNKINSLPIATKAELEEFNDVCAICYHELSNARITRCNHFFHSVCLRKWLYVQDNCPLCHKLIYAPEQVSDPNESVLKNNNQDQQNQPNEGHQLNGILPAPENNIAPENNLRPNHGGTFQPANQLRVHQD